ncbi:MAG: hypothetical protein ACOX6N_01520 [Patescibacteria group bacterium]|jgi:cell division protein FtsB
MKRIKDYILLFGFILILLSIVFNILNQYRVLRNAYGENRNLEALVRETEDENRLLQRKIEYATSSAYLEQQARDKFGLGKAEDYWIEMIPEEGGEGFYPEFTIDDNKSTWKMWLEVFTH